MIYTVCMMKLIVSKAPTHTVDTGQCSTSVWPGRPIKISVTARRPSLDSDCMSATSNACFIHESSSLPTCHRTFPLVTQLLLTSRTGYILAVVPMRRSQFYDSISEALLPILILQNYLQTDC